MRLFDKEGWLIYENSDCATIKELVEKAVREKIDLTNADLFDANLTNANLEWARLTNADLGYTYLREADLGNARLDGANLTNANLEFANLRFADLSNAKLQSAYLSGADLRYANLKNANLRYAHLNYANLIGADLEGAILDDEIKNKILEAEIRHYNILRTELKNLIEGLIDDSSMTDSEQADYHKIAADNLKKIDDCKTVEELENWMYKNCSSSAVQSIKEEVEYQIEKQAALIETKDDTAAKPKIRKM